MDRGAWQATVHRIEKVKQKHNWSELACTHTKEQHMQLHVQNRLITGSAWNRKSYQDKYKHCLPVIVKNKDKYKKKKNTKTMDASQKFCKKLARFLSHGMQLLIMLLILFSKLTLFNMVDPGQIWLFKFKLIRIKKVKCFFSHWLVR